MKPRKLFIAGASGAVGRAVVALADARGIPYVAHYRPGSKAPPPGARSAVLELADTAALLEQLQDSTTVVQLIGTMRKRFAQGDTYETSDVGTTRMLVDAARAAGVDHLVLLSSIGAGRPVGAYLQAKARAETLVAESGIPFTIFRPSAFEGNGHHAPPLLGWATRMLGLSRYQPIEVDTLARALLAVSVQREALTEILEGAAISRHATPFGS